MLITIGRTLGVVPPEALDVVVATAIISITLNPLAFRTIEPLTRRLGRMRFFGSGMVEPLDIGASSSLDPGSRAIVIGHGPTGRTVTRLLRENGISPTVVELNINVVRELREQGLSAVYGDASHTDTLVSAGLPHASTLIVSGADTGSPGIIQCARRSIRPRTSWSGVRTSRRSAVATSRGGTGVCGRRRSRAGDDGSRAATARRDARSDRPRARARARGTHAARSRQSEGAER